MLKINNSQLFQKFLKIPFFLFLIYTMVLFSAIALFSQEIIDDTEKVEVKDILSKDIEIVSVNDIKKTMSSRYESINDYTAEFIWINGDANYRGKIQYKKPDKILMDFEEPADQKIVSNGKVLNVYIPYLKVVCQQSLGEETESSILLTTSEEGLSRLFNEYSFSFYDTSLPRQFGSTMAYHLKLIQKHPGVGFNKIDIWVSKNGLILQSNGVSQNGIKVSLSFSKIKLNTELPDYIFNFEVPTDAQIIRNIIVPFSDKK